MVGLYKNDVTSIITLYSNFSDCFEVSNGCEINRKTIHLYLIPSITQKNICKFVIASLIIVQLNGLTPIIL
jgi:hypothetical protein